jgi:hypothetical protein
VSNRTKIVWFSVFIVAVLAMFGGGRLGVYAQSATSGAVGQALPKAVPTATTGGATPTGGIPSPIPSHGLPTPLPSAVATDCPNPFVDILSNVFYGAIHTLNCDGVISGTDSSHYSPAATATRAQFARIVVKGFGVAFITPPGQSFSDVQSGFFAYSAIESGYAAGILSGYSAAQCGAAGAPYPCYLPNRSITRAELTRLVVNAARYTLITPHSPTFVDVPVSNFAYAYIETAYRKGVVHGTDASHFAPNRNIRRDEMAQIVYEGTITQ